MILDRTNVRHQPRGARHARTSTASADRADFLGDGPDRALPARQRAAEQGPAQEREGRDQGLRRAADLQLCGRAGREAAQGQAHPEVVVRAGQGADGELPALHGAAAAAQRSDGGGVSAGR